MPRSSRSLLGVLAGLFFATGAGVYGLHLYREATAPPAPRPPAREAAPVEVRPWPRTPEDDALDRAADAAERQRAEDRRARRKAQDEADRKAAAKARGGP